MKSEEKDEKTNESAFAISEVVCVWINNIEMAGQSVLCSAYSINFRVQQSPLANHFVCFKPYIARALCSQIVRIHAHFNNKLYVNCQCRKTELTACHRLGAGECACVGSNSADTCSRKLACPTFIFKCAGGLCRMIGSDLYVEINQMWKAHKHIGLQTLCLCLQCYCIE